MSEESGSIADQSCESKEVKELVSETSKLSVNPGDSLVSEGNLVILPGAEGGLDELAKKILTNVEYYFSNANLWVDDFLRKEIEKDADGWVPMSMLLKSPRIRDLTQDIDVLVAALQPSEKLEVSDDESMLRRTTPVPQFNPRRDAKRCIYADNFTPGTSLASIAALFSRFGKVLRVAPCGVPTETTENPDSPGQGLQVLIDFETKDAAKKAQVLVNYHNGRYDMNGSVASTPRSEQSHQSQFQFNAQSREFVPAAERSGSSTPNSTTFSGSSTPNTPLTPLTPNVIAYVQEAGQIEDAFTNIFVMAKYAYLRRLERLKMNMQHAHRRANSRGGSGRNSRRGSPLQQGHRGRGGRWRTPSQSPGPSPGQSPLYSAVSGNRKSPAVGPHGNRKSPPVGPQGNRRSPAVGPQGTSPHMGGQGRPQQGGKGRRGGGGDRGGGGGGRSNKRGGKGGERDMTGYGRASQQKANQQKNSKVASGPDGASKGFGGRRKKNNDE